MMNPNPIIFQLPPESSQINGFDLGLSSNSEQSGQEGFNGSRNVGVIKIIFFGKEQFLSSW